MRASANHTRTRIVGISAIAYQFQMVTRVREFRQMRGWSQAELAHAAGVRTATISKIESTPEKVKVETLMQAAKGLEVTMADLFSDDGTPSLRHLLAVFLRLSPGDREAFIRQMDAMAAARDELQAQ